MNHLVYWFLKLTITGTFKKVTSSFSVPFENSGENVSVLKGT